MRRKLLLAVVLVVVLGGVLLAIAAYRAGNWDTGYLPPAPQAPMAPKWPAPIPGPAKSAKAKPAPRPAAGPFDEATGEPTEDGAAGLREKYGWPDDFRLPLTIEIQPPEVPEQLHGPSRPIERK